MFDPVVSDSDTSLASQCLAFCQTLASQGRTVTFSLKVGSSFAFSLDTKDSEKIPASKARKKLSPSTQKRNERRRKEFLASKEASSPVEKTLNVESTHLASVLELQETTSEEDVNAKVSCDICGHETKTANGIKLHKQKKHQVDQIDGNSSIADIQEDISEEKITQTVKFIDDKNFQTETNIDLVF